MGEERPVFPWLTITMLVCATVVAAQLLSSASAATNIADVRQNPQPLSGQLQVSNDVGERVAKPKGSDALARSDMHGKGLEHKTRLALGALDSRKRSDHVQRSDFSVDLRTLNLKVKEKMGSFSTVNFTLFSASNDDTSNVECSDVKKQNHSEMCDFVLKTDDCDIGEGFINYTQSIFCTFGIELLPLGVTVLIIWWLFLFIGLAVAADKFFCPSLVVIAKTLRMTDNIAGVTLMACGNGAPDIFSAVAAISTMKKGDAGLAVGALVGAGVFVTTIVAGSIAVVTPFHAMERPFLRDIVFFLLAIFMTFYVFYSRVITLLQSILFIVVYIVYVFVVLFGRYIYQKQKQRQSSLENPSPEEGPDESSSVSGTGRPVTPISDRPAKTLKTSAHHEAGLESDGGQSVPSELTPLLGSVTNVLSPPGAARTFIRAIWSQATRGWEGGRWYLKVYIVFKMPLELILLLTVPIVDFDMDNRGWNRHLNCLHCITAPVITIICINHAAALHKLGGVFPVWALIMLLGAVAAVAVYFTSVNDTPPVYHRIFAVVGFFTAVFYIDAIANEIVNILQTFGLLFNISNAILGLTLLAWGNSLADLIADLTMAKQGQPKIGISACFGGPMFNLLIGIGVPFTIKTIKDGSVELDFTVIQVLLLAALAASLISSLIILPLIRFNLNRFYGIYLYILYAVFIVLAVLIESRVIQGQI